MSQASIDISIRTLAGEYLERFKKQTEDSGVETGDSHGSRFLIHKVFGLTEEEGRLIDILQKKGEIFSKYASLFLETAALWCFREKFPEAASCRIRNTEGRRPKAFEIDYLVGKYAIQIKGQDASTAIDHVAKENRRIKVLADAGYVPIRVAFCYPNNLQALQIQQTIKTSYADVGGQYYFGEGAWSYVRTKTGVDLKAILEELAEERMMNNVAERWLRSE